MNSSTFLSGELAMLSMPMSQSVRGPRLEAAENLPHPIVMAQRSPDRDAEFWEKI